MSIAAFNAYLHLEKNYSKHTVQTYTKDIEAFAMRRGLQKLEDVVEGFSTDFHNEKLIYVVDKSGRYAEQLEKSDKNVIPLGKVVTKEQYFSSTGPYDQEVEKTVYARPPGLYE